MKRFLISIITSVSVISALAEIPAGYYTPLDGKKGDALLTAIKNLSEGHTKITYNTKTWPAFETTDVRTINGKLAWWDMYSNNIVWLPGHDAMNIEHSVANSWWGGVKNDAYADLFHLNPSDQLANGKKGNYPPGEVVDARILDNGLLKIGTPAAGQGGSAQSVFEPADEYKGDFARAYFYIYATYPDMAWKDEYAYAYNADGTLADWAKTLLLKWNSLDPVDSKEIARNEAIYTLQNNRNPFIDYPQLAELTFGNQTDAFNLAGASAASATDRPEAPVFKGCRLTGVNTYSLRWWDGITLPVEYGNYKLMLSIDGRDYFEPTLPLTIDPAIDGSEAHTYKAYCVATSDGKELKSPVATLILNASDPNETDYSLSRWEIVSDASQIKANTPYVILSSNTLHVMSTDGGVTAKKFLESGGFVEFDNQNRIIELPVNSAIIKFGTGSTGKYAFDIYNIQDEFLGHWHATAKNNMLIDRSIFSPGTADISSTGTFTFTFDQYGSLQFNKSQPRFLNYETTQTPVYLYKYVDNNGGSSSVGTLKDNDVEWRVGVSGNDIIKPEGASVYDLNGRMISCEGLRPGIYIVAGFGKATKLIIK